MVLLVMVVGRRGIIMVLVTISAFCVFRRFCVEQDDEFILEESNFDVFVVCLHGMLLFKDV